MVTDGKGHFKGFVYNLEAREKLSGSYVPSDPVLLHMLPSAYVMKLFLFPLFAMCIPQQMNSCIPARESEINFKAIQHLFFNVTQLSCSYWGFANINHNSPTAA